MANIASVLQRFLFILAAANRSRVADRVPRG